MRSEPLRRSSLPAFRRFGGTVWHLLFGKAARWRAERVEERDWRRRIILASRKIQQVQLALGENLEDVRGLRENLDRSASGLEKLETYVERAERLFGGIEDKLGAHERTLQGGLDRLADMGLTPPPPDDAPSREELEALEAKLQELQIYARGRDELCEEKDREYAALEDEATATKAALVRATVELDAIKSQLEESAEELFRQRDELCREKDQVVAALTMQVEELRGNLSSRTEERDALRKECEEQHVEELTELRSLLESQQARVAELESALAEKERGENLELAHLREELDGVQRMSAARIEELEAQNRLLAAKPDGLAARHEQEIAELERRAAERAAELEVQIRSLEAAREEAQSRHARELGSLREESEWRIQVLEERARMLEDGRAEVEKTRAMAQQAAEARLAELERQLRAERGREQRVHELEAEVARLRQAPPSAGGREERIAELEAEVEKLKEVRAQLDVVHVHEIARVKRTFRKEIQGLQQELERARREAPAPPSSAAAPAASAAAPDAATEGAIRVLEQKLQEKEAMYALISSRNVDLERQVAKLTEALGGETTWPSQPHFPAAEAPEAAATPGALLQPEGEAPAAPAPAPHAKPAGADGTPAG